jgi:hypothetical protein
LIIQKLESKASKISKINGRGKKVRKVKPLVLSPDPESNGGLLHNPIIPRLQIQQTHNSVPPGGIQHLNWVEYIASLKRRGIHFESHDSTHGQRVELLVQKLDLGVSKINGVKRSKMGNLRHS